MPIFTPLTGRPRHAPTWSRLSGSGAYALIALAFASSFAFAALPIPARCDVGVEGVQFMPVNTMRATCISRGWTDAPHVVLAMGHGFEVGGIYAAPISTQVVNLKTNQYRSYEKTIGEAVHVVETAVNPNSAVTVCVDVSGPIPAAIAVDLNFHLPPTYQVERMV